MLLPAEHGNYALEKTPEPTLVTLMLNQRVGTPTQWGAANAEAARGCQKTFSVQLKGDNAPHGAQKYLSKSLPALRDKYATVSKDTKVLKVI